MTTVHINLPDDWAAKLADKAAAHGMTLEDWIARRLADEEAPAAESSGERSSVAGFETGYGIWAKYGPAPSAQEIDENRREMFRNFAQDV